MPNTDSFLLNQRYTDLVVITEEQKDFQTNGNTTQKPPLPWSQLD